MKSSEITENIYSQMVLTSVSRPSIGKKIFSSTDDEVTTLFTCKRIKMHSSLTSYTKIHSKWIKNLSATTKTIT
jgi:hypothetical protein